jgi:hypothetical protein
MRAAVHGPGDVSAVSLAAVANFATPFAQLELPGQALFTSVQDLGKRRDDLAVRGSADQGLKHVV